MDKRPLICDTSLLLYLGRIQHVELLSELFDPVYVPDAVVLELDMGRVLRNDTLDPRNVSWMSIVAVPDAMLNALPANRLGLGEQSVIAYARGHSQSIAGLDDKQARLLAESLDLPVIGTLGIFLHAQRAGLIPAVRPLLDAVVAQGFRMTAQLYDAVIALSGDYAPGGS